MSEPAMTPEELSKVFPCQVAGAGGPKCDVLGTGRLCSACQTVRDYFPQTDAEWERQANRPSFLRDVLGWTEEYGWPDDAP